VIRLVDIYYWCRPWLSRAMQIRLRRWAARRKRRRTGAVWPILEAAGRRPEGWPGWPDGKPFALVLTHDVETAAGLANCRPLMELEESLGFRSCFNFVPEDYPVPAELREEMVRRGFEVGVHGLTHDARTFKNRRIFERRAVRINRYLKEWNAVGFRAPLMTHNLDWIGELDIRYDSSTFDTDPFEPQPDGIGTIFPFWVPGRNGRPGFVELPYTLPQDFNLFIIQRESTIDIWKTKLAWIVERGGMALLEVHPDYLAFDEAHAAADRYPATRYQEFLAWIKAQFRDRHWNPLPRQVAAFVWNERENMPVRTTGKCRKIWIDLDNTPHVPFFRPIIAELERRGFEVLLTARDAFQVCELADQVGFRYRRIGRHYGQHKFRKVFGLAYRSLQLLTFVRTERPDLAVSHGSRSQLFLANLLRIPTVLLEDYEHAAFPWPLRPRWCLAPEAIPTEAAPCDPSHVLHYPGIKEDVYVPFFKPVPGLRARLGIDDSAVMVVVRPPATEAHYHNPAGEELFEAAMEHVVAHPATRIVLLPRNRKQSEALARRWGDFLRAGKIVIPSRAIDGLNLLWHADLMISGGGTMNREAAALGVPVYSIFLGPTGAVDRQLAQTGRLGLIQNVQALERSVQLRKRERSPVPAANPSPVALVRIVDHLLRIAATP